MDIVTVSSLWAASSKKHGVVIPFSICWRLDGRCVMGAGLALQAARRWPSLQHELGTLCKKAGDATPIVVRPSKKWCSHIFLLPIRSLNKEQPHLGWRGPICPELVESRLRSLQRYVECHSKKESTDKIPDDKIVVPTLEDELPQDEASLFIHLVEKTLDTSHFILARTAKGTFVAQDDT